jgi:tetratricopeptide (TPR) repeat protein
MGTGFEVTGSPVLALFRYQKAIARDPKHAGALFEAGSIHFERGELDDAKDLLDRALAAGLTGPRRADALNQLALVAEVRKDRDEARQIFESAMAEFPDHALLRANYGFFLYECRDGRARHELESALHMFAGKGQELSLGRRQAVANLARILFDAGGAREAVDLIEDHALKDPLMLQARPDIAAALARGYQQLGEKQRAEEIPVRRARIALPLGLPLPILARESRRRVGMTIALIGAIAAALTSALYLMLR